MKIIPINNQCTTYLNTRNQNRTINFKLSPKEKELYTALDTAVMEHKKNLQSEAARRKANRQVIHRIYGLIKQLKPTNVPTVKENLKVGYNGWTEMHRFCKDGNITAVKNVYKAHPNLNLNQLTDDGRSCVEIAKYFGRKDIVNFIVSRKNYDPTVMNDYGRTDLHYLCSGSSDKDWAKPVKTILRKHKDLNLNCLDKGGWSYMHLAANAKNYAIVNLLAGMKNYDPTVANSYGCTDLHYLLEKGGFTKAVKKILRKHKDININQLTNNRDSYVAFAAWKRDEEIVNALVKMKNYNPTVKGKDGWTDIHLLCRYGCTKALNTVFEKYHDIIDMNQLTDSGKSYMDLAREWNQTEVINILAKYI